MLTVLFALTIVGIIPATSVNAVELVSVNKDGTDSGDYYSEGSAISADGRFVVFTSAADDLVATADTNGMEDVFVRDLQSGTTTLVSVNKEGSGSGNEESINPVISADGRIVAFQSNASDLVAADTNGVSNVFVRDLESGTTTLVSVNKDRKGAGNYYSSYPVISADGRFVAYVSLADDLVAMDSNNTVDVFVHDLQEKTTTLVSVNEEEKDSGNGWSIGPEISGDGRYVVYFSMADNLVAKDTNNKADVLVRDLKNGNTALVSIGKDVNDSGNDMSTNPVISTDGRFVAFVSIADDLVATDTNDTGDVFVRDLQEKTTTLVSIDKDVNDSGNDWSSWPVISADGRYVAFESHADNLVATDTNDTGDVFVRDLQEETTTLVSIGKDVNDSGNDWSSWPVISADGRFVAFGSVADDLVAADTNETDDVFVRDLQSGTTTIVSLNKDGNGSGNDSSLEPVISADGRVVAFNSLADDLVSKDTNEDVDVFVFEVFETPKGCDCADPDAIKGTLGRDYIYGSDQADIICGFGGQDFIAGMDGDDCIDGGDGDDWIYGGRDNDTIFGQAGKDVIYGDRGNDEISGDEDEDYLFGGRGDDKLDGGEGYDWVFCGSGTDEGIGEYLRKCED